MLLLWKGPYISLCSALMVHAHERLVVRECEGLGALGADAQTDLEAGPDGDGDGVHIGRGGEAGAPQRQLDRPAQRVAVCVARDPRHDGS